MIYTWSDSSNWSGYQCGCDSHSSYNFTESGMHMTALSSKSGNVPGQSPLSPMGLT